VIQLESQSNGKADFYQSSHSQDLSVKIAYPTKPPPAPSSTLHSSQHEYP
jgi:hypothetical protein